MRIGILGDVHANMEALTQVVEAMRTESIDHWVQVGDIVGYGPEPCEAMDLVLQELQCTVCVGNHDAAVVGLLDPEYFNSYARQAIEWTRAHLRPQDFASLKQLPLVVEHADYTLVHGTLHMPELFGYVLTQVEARESLRQQRTRISFVGHSHVPAIYIERPGVNELEMISGAEPQTTFPEDASVLVNVGSVGQPRDEDPRAAYCIYDTQTRAVAIKRISYDIAAVQDKIRKAGLPDMLADRLALGV